MSFTTGRLPLLPKGATEPRRSFVYAKHMVFAIEAKPYEHGHMFGGETNEVFEIMFHSSQTLNGYKGWRAGTRVVLNKRDLVNLMRAVRSLMADNPESPMLVEIPNGDH